MTDLSDPLTDEEIEEQRAAILEIGQRALDATADATGPAMKRARKRLASAMKAVAALKPPR